jgi:hypothetical protein
LFEAELSECVSDIHSIRLHNAMLLTDASVVLEGLANSARTGPE